MVLKSVFARVGSAGAGGSKVGQDLETWKKVNVGNGKPSSTFPRPTKCVYIYIYIDIYVSRLMFVYIFI